MRVYPATFRVLVEKHTGTVFFRQQSIAVALLDRPIETRFPKSPYVAFGEKDAFDLAIAEHRLSATLATIRLTFEPQPTFYPPH